MLDLNTLKNIMLEELRHKGYNPNPSDVHVAATRIQSLASLAIDEALLEAAAQAGAPELDKPPAK